MIKKRIEKLRERMKLDGLDVMLITSYENYRYFSGFCGSNCVLLISDSELTALTDGRYTTQIKEQAPDFGHIIIEKSMTEHICSLLSDYSNPRVGYETHDVRDFQIRALRERADFAEFVPEPDFGAEIRSIKTFEETENIRRAAAIADCAFASLTENLKSGMTEREAAALLEYEMARGGSLHPAFETIAASGVRSAMPHAVPSDAPICDNSLMTFDFGACFNGYMSDITRTVFIGNVPKKLCELWDAVFEVQRECVKKVCAGVLCSDLNDFQLDLFASYGLEKLVMHSLGHGVGLAIHELPNVSRSSKTVLCEDMVITIEPGLYIEGLGGVRIEDTVIVKNDGAEIITKSPYRYNITLG